MNPFFDLPPIAVRAHFAPHTDGLTWHRVPGGFSGACVYRGGDSLALKLWPQGTTPERVRQIHEWLALVEHLPFVPNVVRGASGSVAIEREQVWDCCRWMPGAPRANPTAAEVRASCELVARLHEAWSTDAQRGPCPGVANRLRILNESEALLRGGAGALPRVHPQLDPILRRAVEALLSIAPRAVRALEPWVRHTFAIHPCVRDLRAEHVLFDGDKVSAIIDYGAGAVDHASVDLARLLGDYAGEDDALFAAGMSAYRAARPAFDAPDEFVRLLARSGVVCSVARWVVRLAEHREPVSEPAVICSRLVQLLTRLAQIALF